MAKKTFSKRVGDALDTAAADGVNLGGEIGLLLAEIPQAAVGSGDDMISDFLDTVNDLTAKETPLAEIVELPEVAAEKKAPDPGQLGDPTEINAEFVERVGAIRKTGKSLQESEKLAKAQVPATPPNNAVTGEYYGTDPQGAVPPPEPLVAPMPEARAPLTEQQLQGNQIAAEELIELYDTLQSVSSMWAFDYFTEPKNAVKIVEELTEKVIGGRASDAEKSAFATAQKTVTGYAGRKAKYAEQVAMSQNLKTRATRLLDKILEVRGVSIPPEALLALLLFMPIAMNAGKIMVERFGFKDADEILKKFSGFVDKAEAEHYKESPRTE